MFTRAAPLSVLFSSLSRAARASTALLLVCVACSNKADSGDSCIFPDGTCTTQRPSKSTSGSPVGSACEDMGGANAAACSTEDLMGTCVGKKQDEFVYYGSTKYLWASDAKYTCERGTTWSGSGDWMPSPNAEATSRRRALPTVDRVLAACDMDWACVDSFPKPSENGLKQLRIACEDAGGKPRTMPCSRAKLNGACLATGASIAWAPDSTSETLRSMCRPPSHWYEPEELKELLE